MSQSSGELWGYSLMPSKFDLIVLLPSGVMCEFLAQRDWTLEFVKKKLWEEAKKAPLFHLLEAPDKYIFSSVTLDAAVEEFFNEKKHLSDLKLFQAILKLIIKPCTRDDDEIALDCSLREVGITIKKQDEEGQKRNLS